MGGCRPCICLRDFLPMLFSRDIQSHHFVPKSFEGEKRNGQCWLPNSLRIHRWQAFCRKSFLDFYRQTVWSTIQLTGPTSSCSLRWYDVHLVLYYEHNTTGHS